MQESLPRTPGREAHRPLVIGHRGFRARYPENTVSGVRAALAAGSDGVEVDVRLTRDGVWVCHHDRANRGLQVGQHTWRELGRWGVNSLEAVLDEVPSDRWLYLEIKPLSGRTLEGGITSLERLLGARAALLRILSSSPIVLKRSAALLPEATPSLIIRRVNFPDLPSSWSLSPHHTLVERLLWTGRELHPWTVNHPLRQRHLATLGIPSITTDDPERALAAFATAPIRR
jgi:glycerophosphoryl diester phosphodiesterase